MQKKRLYKIGQGLAGKRLDRVLQVLTGLSRKKVKGLLDTGLVTVGGRKVVIASWETTPGDQIEVQDEQVPERSSKEYYLKVVHEDAHILVVEKDPGVPCEISPLATRPTLVSIINAYFKRKLPHLKYHYLGPIHRLDTETSGLMVYSKTKEGNKLTEQFKRHSIKRKYLAVVQGRIEQESGKIEGYLKKSNLLKEGKKVAISTPESGRLSVTHFKVRERYDKATLTEIALDTGRTHQIRVQMTSIGHPVVGDKIYGRGGVAFPRQALHAAYLSFHHPVTGEKMEFSSELPKDLRKLVDRLREQS